MHKKLLLLFLIIISSLKVNAQHFKWQAGVEQATKNGFYQILLKPGIKSKMNHTLGDIRLYNQAGTEIPYLMHTEKPVERTKMFNNYPVIEKEHRKNWGHTRLVIHNLQKNTINNIVLRIRNSDVSKWLKLSGSDNRKDWYIIKDNYHFHSIYNESATSEIRILNFPTSNYEYYEILVNDYFNKPIDIIEVGYYRPEKEKGKYSALPAAAIIQNDSLIEKHSFIRINLPDTFYVNRINFSINYPTFYYRKADLLKAMVDNKNDTSWIKITQLELSSNTTNDVVIPEVIAKNLALKIQNNDNQALKIKSVKLFQLNTYLTARLENNFTYHLEFGNTKVAAPVYDLPYFKDSIPDNLPVLNITGIEKNPLPKTKEKKGIKKIHIWIILVAVIALLGILSIKMIRDIRPKNKG